MCVIQVRDISRLFLGENSSHQLWFTLLSLELALAPDRTMHTDMQKAVALLEHDKHQKVTSTQEKAVVGFQLPLNSAAARNEHQRQLSGAVEILASDTLGTAAPWHSPGQPSRIRLASAPCPHQATVTHQLFSPPSLPQAVAACPDGKKEKGPHTQWFILLHTKVIYIRHAEESNFYLVWLLLLFGRIFWPPTLNNSFSGNTKDNWETLKWSINLRYSNLVFNDFLWHVFEVNIWTWWYNIRIQLLIPICSIISMSYFILVNWNTQQDQWVLRIWW